MRPLTDHPRVRALGIPALAALLHFAQPAPISAQDAGSGVQASARAVATVVSVQGVHEAQAMLARVRVDFARREAGGVVVEARREAPRGGLTVTVAHLGN